MEFLPKIGILNPFDTIGDCVLIEPIARQLGEAVGTDVAVVCSYPELFVGHPTVQSVSSSIPAGMRIIDMTDAIRSLEKQPSGKSIVIPGKVRRMYEEAGLFSRDIVSPQLYLTEQELEHASVLDEAFSCKRMGLALDSKHSFKNLPYTKYLIKQLVRRGWQVFVFGQAENGEYDYLDKLPVTKMLDEPIRKVMMYIALMDVCVGPDTGLLHIAGALDVPFVVATREVWRDLYECYNVGEILATRQFGKHSMSTWATTPRRMLKAIDRQYTDTDEAVEVTEASVETPPQSGRSEIAIFRLDGMGGTITVTDQAKKIFEATGVKPDLIVRGFATLFAGIPYINNVVEVGGVVWGDCLAQMLEAYDTIAEIRFGPAKWHQKSKQWFEQDFTAMQGIFDAFPIDYKELEIHEMHHVQLTSMCLGLPYDTIDMEVRNIERYDGALPEQFVAVANGVDGQYKGMKQTKSWEGWDELPPLLDMPVVQVGMVHDNRINGAIDLRGKTSLPQLCDVLQRADGVVCTEGGIMHLTYALGCENAFILRGPTRGKLFEYPGQRWIDSHVCDICWGDTGDWYANCARGVGAVCMKTITPERVAMNVQEVRVEDMVEVARV